MKRLAVLSTGRQDYAGLRSTCLALESSKDFALSLLVGGMHLDPKRADSLDAIVADGLPIAKRLPTFSVSPVAEASATVAAIADAIIELRTDALLLLGDRSETTAAALAATISGVPIVHLHGGEETEGAIDNALRHAITKLSHLHLVSHPEHARRVVLMGEDPTMVHVVGAPALDNLHRPDLADRCALEAFFGLTLDSPIVLVTHHGTTLGEDPAVEVAALIEAMATVDARYLITLPNNDKGSEVVRAQLERFAATNPARAAAREALGPARYFGALKVADAILGNSSSAIIEAPVYGLPAVNVGDRQKGRLRGANVLDVPPVAAKIAEALRRAISLEYRKSIANAPCPFGDGHSAARIMKILGAWDPPRPPRKRFFEVAP